MPLGKVIHFHKYLKNKDVYRNKKRSRFKKQKKNLLDFTLRGQRIVKKEQREVKRVVLNGLVGITIIVPLRGLMRVEVQDISTKGISFDFPKSYGSFRRKELLELRLYLNHEVYVPFSARVESKRIYFKNGTEIVRHGLKFQDEPSNKESLNAFIYFLETIAVHCRTDSGDKLILDV